MIKLPDDKQVNNVFIRCHSFQVLDYAKQVLIFDRIIVRNCR